ncbi:DUF6438 domain-containing protein [Chitinophaga varians]|uniref:DUF6438 domain-containing protein n=1 Tax=Chitinophaga varians TaxID=2202339 RepID=UPI00165FBDF8|nr:DUF6438 domain-containing protein [Chitinophaga varians]MBC9911143.1 hypothetical protein [Chitinophaga varians]
MLIRSLLLILFVLPATIMAQSKEALLQKTWAGPELSYVVFDSTTCSFDFFGQFRRQTGYTVQGDTIRVLNRYTSSRDHFSKTHIEDRDFLIKRLTKDSLVLAPVNQYARELVNGQPVLYYKDIQLTATDTIRFDSLFFRSTTCFGTCPSIRLQIDNNRQLKFRGREYAVQQGDFTGTLPDSVYQEVLRGLSIAALDQLKTWEQRVADAPRYILIVWYNQKCRYIDNYYLPLGTRALITCLLNVPRNTPLQKSEQPLVFVDPYTIIK